MEEYKSNSHKFKDEQGEKKIEKVITGKAKVKNKSGIEKLVKVFIAEDIHDIKSYILREVIIPKLKDVVIDTIQTIFHGESTRSKNNSTASKVSYRNYYEKENERRDFNSPKTRSGYRYDDIILDNRGEAEDVLLRMDELVATYGLVSVADMYDLVGITGDYTDNKYGWTDIRSASVARVRDGYMLKLPKALPLN